MTDNPNTTKLETVRPWGSGFDCLSGDGTTLAVRLDANEDGGIGIMCSAAGRNGAYYFMADAPMARLIAIALNALADKAEQIANGR